MQRWIIGVVVGAVLVAALGVGCGGGDDSTTTITKVAFIKQAESVCDKMQDELSDQLADFEKGAKSRGEKVGGQANLDTRVEDVYVPVIQGEAEKLEALGAPAADEKKIEAMIQNLNSASEIMEDEKAAGMERAGASLEKFIEQGTDYGLKCT
ncbi:MAG TPA: hypothetical protein VFN92_12700 [Solirubrobacterales bacterium]|nr:hypothetical protein [Solirubrobacterales bacterium]